MIKSLLTTLTLTSALAPVHVLANEWRGGGGIAVTPQFEGSADYTVRPAPSFSYQGKSISVRSSGPGLEADLFASRAIDAGPILRYNFGRNPSNIEDAAVAALPKIDGALQLGGYAQVNFPLGSDFTTFLSPRLSVLQDIGGAGGTLAEGSVGLVKRAEKATFGARLSTTFASADYMDQFFSVAPASPSGLPAFSAGSGVKDVRISLFANYKLNERWSATGVAGYKRLLNDAAGSPIVSVAGQRDQGFVAIGFSYSFN